jgi:hypothetical protein
MKETSPRQLSYFLEDDMSLTYFFVPEFEKCPIGGTVLRIWNELLWGYSAGSLIERGFEMTVLLRVPWSRVLRSSWGPILYMLIIRYADSLCGTATTP